MKAFIISTVALTLILFLAVFNSIFIYNVTNSLIEDAQGLSIDNNSVSEYAERWEDLQPLIKISSSHKETHRIDEVIGVLKAKTEHQISSGFEEEKSLLIEYLIQIQEDEKVTFDSII
ncbi:MAG: hypothetical protein IJ039_01595 [Clostridia bacterium]|nr:hypothetical protein [Clostridia bacterium]